MVNGKREFDKVLLGVTLALAGTGLVMVYSSSTVWAEANSLDSSFLLTRQFIRVLAGVMLMLIVMRIDYHVFAKRAGLLLAAALILLGTVLIVRYTVKGASRSLPVPVPVLGAAFSSFQPAELAKLALIIYLSDVLVKRQRVIASFHDGLLPHALLIGVTLVLIMLQPDVGTGLAVGAAAAILLFVAKVRFSHLLATGAACVPVVGWYVYSVPYRRIRVIGFLHPNEYTDGINYQINQALIAFSKGGVFGVGLGQSRQKLLFLPEPFTDFIFPIIGEEFGLVGTVLVLGLLLVFVSKGAAIARRAPDLFGFFLGVGITSMIGVYAAINLGVTMALLPTTGLALPFISYGGSGLLIGLISTGILLNISRQGSAAGVRTERYVGRKAPARGALS